MPPVSRGNLTEGQNGSSRLANIWEKMISFIREPTNRLGRGMCWKDVVSKIIKIVKYQYNWNKLRDIRSSVFILDFRIVVLSITLFFMNSTKHYSYCFDL